MSREKNTRARGFSSSSGCQHTLFWANQERRTEKRRCAQPLGTILGTLWHTTQSRGTGGTKRPGAGSVFDASRIFWRYSSIRILRQLTKLACKMLPIVSRCVQHTLSRYRPPARGTGTVSTDIVAKATAPGGGLRVNVMPGGGGVEVGGKCAVCMCAPQ